jgi:hypothetical protein
MQKGAWCAPHAQVVQDRVHQGKDLLLANGVVDGQLQRVVLGALN